MTDAGSGAQIPEAARAFLIAIVLFMGLLFSGGGLSQPGDEELGYGTVTAPGDPDVVAELNAPDAGASICTHDEDGSGDYSAGDPVYLAIGASDCAAEPGQVSTHWVRLVATDAGEAGSRVRSTDPDHGEGAGRLFDLDSFNVDLLRYYDANDNDAFDEGDSAYLSQSAQVDPGDVRLTANAGHSAGTAVGNSDSDRNFALARWQVPRIQAAAHYLEVDQQEGFTRGDVAYLLGTNEEPGDEPVPRVNDVRLGTIGPDHGFGERVRADDPDGVAVLKENFSESGTPHDGSLCALSQDGSSNYRPGDTVYFVPGSTDCRNQGRVQAQDLRLNGEQAGTKVRIGDEDHNHGGYLQLDGPGDAGTAFLGYHDTSPFGSFTEGDGLYLMTESGRDEVRVGDIRLTPSSDHEAGSWVEAGDVDQNLPLAAFVPTGPANHMELFAFHDINGNDAYDWDDVLVVRTDPQEARLLHNMVRLGSNGPTSGYGTFTRAGDPGVSMPLDLLRENGADDAVCGIDENDNERYDPNESVILRREGTCSDRSSFSDLRLTTSDHGSRGTLLRSGDGDWNRFLVPFGDDVCLDQTGGSSALSDPGAALYLTRCTATLSEGDLRLTDHGTLSAGTVVRESDDDHDQDLRDGDETAQSARTWDLDNVFYYHDTHSTGRLSTGGLVYLALHNPPDGGAPLTTTAQVHNVRLTPVDHLLPPSAVPGHPRDLSATPGDGEVLLNWQPPQEAAPVRGYVVEWGAEPGEPDESMPVVETSVVIEGLTNAVEYFFIVRATNELGDGPRSEEVNATPGPDAPGGVPQAPTNLDVEVLGSDQVEVSWAPPGSGAPVREYQVRAGTSPGGPYSSAWNATEPPLTVDGLERGGRYSFIIVAVNDVGESPPSQEVTVTLPEGEETPALPLLSVLVVLVLGIGAVARRR